MVAARGSQTGEVRAGLSAPVGGETIQKERRKNDSVGFVGRLEAAEGNFFLSLIA